MTSLWPAAESGTEIDALRSRTDLLLPGVAAIARRQGLATAPLEHIQAGSLPVFALADHRILKLYPPLCQGDFVTESRVLAHLGGRIPAPRLLATGDLEGWSYVVMSRLGGRALGTRDPGAGEACGETWDAIAPRDRLSLARALGRLLAALHALPTAGLTLPPPAWPAFLSAQLAHATEIQAGRGLGSPWLEQIEPFLRSVAGRAGLADHAELVLLHTEISREHVFVDRAEDGGWEITGILDFEPAMIGAREYEFASVGMFTALGDAAFLRELLLAYGYAERDLGPDLQRRLMAWLILHRFSSIPWYLRRIPPAPGVETFDLLARHWFALDAPPHRAPVER